MKVSATTTVTVVFFLAAFVVGAQGTDGEGELPSLEEIDRQLNNPLSKTWALTLQDNIGIQEGDLVDESTWNNLLFFQPMLPVPVSKSLTFSGRPVFPLVTSPNVDFSTGETDGHTTGLGDIQLMTLIGPDKADGWVWGAGATFKFPTGTDPTLSQGTYQAGPAAMLLNMGRPWVYGFLFQHWSSFAGDDSRDTSFTDFQYIIRYRWSKLTNIGCAPNIRYNWETEQLNLPIGIGFDTLVKLGPLPVKIGAELYYYVVKSDDFGPEWQFRLLFVPVLPSPSWARTPLF